MRWGVVCGCGLSLLDFRAFVSLKPELAFLGVKGPERAPPGGSQPQYGRDAKPARTHPCRPTLQAFFRCAPKSGCARVSDPPSTSGVSRLPQTAHTAFGIREPPPPRRKAWRPPAPARSQGPRRRRPSVALGRSELILAPQSLVPTAPPPHPATERRGAHPAPPDSASPAPEPS